MLAEDYRVSRFAHVLMRQDAVALYHSLWQQPLFVRTGQICSLRPLDRSDLILQLLTLYPRLEKECLERQLIVHRDFDEQRLVGDIASAHLQVNHLKALYLVLSTACNARCEYCFLEVRKKGFYDGEFMSAATAARAIDRFAEARSLGSTPSIVFYGGEPLLNQPALLSSLAHIRRLQDDGLLPCTTRISVVTNGTLMSRALARQLKQYPVSVSVSLDGPAEIHNAGRVLAGGEPSFAPAFAGCQVLREEGIPLTISCTISGRNAEHLCEIVHWFVDQFGTIGISLNPPLDSPSGSTSPSEMREYAVSALEAFFAARSLGVHEEYVGRKAKAVATGALVWSSCGSGGDQIVVAPDASVGPCQRYVGTPIHFKDLSPLEYRYEQLQQDGLFRSWRERSPLLSLGCSGCIALGNCGGGCGCNSLAHGEALHTMDKTYCEYATTLTEGLIWDIYGQMVSQGWQE